jgi:hypothetical protein
MKKESFSEVEGLKVFVRVRPLNNRELQHPNPKKRHSVLKIINNEV